jgi:hypothetical protein
MLNNLNVQGFALNKRIIIILSVCIAIVVIASSSVLGLYIFRWADNVQTYDFGLNFSLDSHLISVPQRGSTEVHFTVWLDSNITSETPINLTARLDSGDYSNETKNSFNLTVTPEVFTLQPNHRMNCILTISPGDQTPAGRYGIWIDAPVRNDSLARDPHGIEIRGYLSFNFAVAHWVPPNTASIDYWLDVSQTFSASDDSYLTAYCKNWGDVDGSFNLTVSLGNGVFKEKDMPSHDLLNSSTVTFPIKLHAGEQKSINFYFSVNDDSRFNVSLSVSSSQQNLCTEPRYISASSLQIYDTDTEYRSLSYVLEDGIWSASIFHVF